MPIEDKTFFDYNKKETVNGETNITVAPCLQAILQIEFGEEAQYLQFLKEYNLTEKPLQMDTLIIKAVSGRKIRKKIGAFFRQYNIVEYKAPRIISALTIFTR